MWVIYFISTLWIGFILFCFKHWYEKNRKGYSPIEDFLGWIILVGVFAGGFFFLLILMILLEIYFPEIVDSMAASIE